jgi:hypothetical protein
MADRTSLPASDVEGRPQQSRHGMDRDLMQCRSASIVIARAGARPRTSRLVYGPLSRRGPVTAYRPQTVRSSTDNDFQLPTEPTV